MDRNETADDEPFDYEGYLEDSGASMCSHIGIVSISETECQCMDCLRVWPKEKSFKSDWPDQDRG